jgi:hypothetical protein
LQDQRAQVVLELYRDTTVYKEQALHFASRSCVAVVAVVVVEAFSFETEGLTFY